jgi:hypothetical protein
MNALKQLFTLRGAAVDRRDVLADLGSRFKMDRLEIGRPLGAVLVLALILIVLLTAYWFAAMSLSSMQANYDARHELLDLLRRRNETNGVWLRSPAGKGLRDLFLSAPTETLAASTLDDEIRQAAADAQTIVFSSHPEVDHDSQSAGDKVEIKAVMAGKIDALQAFLFHLETGTPMIFVENISLETGNGEIDDGADADPSLHATATFVAYWHSSGRQRAPR